MVRKKTIENSFWIPINAWNLNELFTTESISPICFYKERSFGNPINRNQEKIEDPNNLILFNEAVQSDVLLKLSPDLLDFKYLTEIKYSKKINLKSFEYSKTIYLKKDLFNVYFSNQEKLDEFLNNAFMLLEVKSINRYKTNFVVDETISRKNLKAIYQTRCFSNKNEIQPYFDKAFNQIKGLIYAYFIGSIRTLGDKEQGLISNLSNLKNTIGAIHTDIVMTDQYSNSWLIDVRNLIEKCQQSYFYNFDKKSDILEMLVLRLDEIDNLNKHRCSDLKQQGSLDYQQDFEIEQEKLEKVKQLLYKYESEHEIAPLKKELTEIKLEEENNGKIKGKTREYFKKDTYEYNRKQELKRIIANLEDNCEYRELKETVQNQKEKVRNFQFVFTQYDTSITEQFSRISESLNVILRKTTSFFLSENNKSDDFPDISFEIDIKKLANYYFNFRAEYTDFSVKLPNEIVAKLSESELNLVLITLNSILSHPQGELGSFSEQNILEIIKNIGEHLPESLDRQILREYYTYRNGKKDSFIFPDNSILANLIVFLMKLNSPEQINKMLVSRSVENKHIAFMFYGTYIGFANMPKTFTGIIFESNNAVLFDYIDNYLFDNLLNYDIL